MQGTARAWVGLTWWDWSVRGRTLECAKPCATCMSVRAIHCAACTFACAKLCCPPWSGQFLVQWVCNSLCNVHVRVCNSWCRAHLGIPCTTCVSACAIPGAVSVQFLGQCVSARATPGAACTLAHALLCALHTPRSVQVLGRCARQRAAPGAAGSSAHDCAPWRAHAPARLGVHAPAWRTPVRVLRGPAQRSVHPNTATQQPGRALQRLGWVLQLLQGLGRVDNMETNKAAEGSRRWGLCCLLWQQQEGFGFPLGRLRLSRASPLCLCIAGEHKAQIPQGLGSGWE